MTPNGARALGIAWGTAALAASFGIWLAAVVFFVAGLAVIFEDSPYG